MADGSYISNLTSSALGKPPSAMDNLVSSAADIKKRGAESDAAVAAEGVAKKGLIAEGEKPGGALSPPELTPYKPLQPEGPWQAFGQPAMWLAAFGGALTRTHLTTALQAGAGVVNALNTKNYQEEQKHFEQYKVAQENALKMFEYKQKVFDKIWNAAGVDSATKLAQAATAGATFGVDRAVFQDEETARKNHLAEKEKVQKMGETALTIQQKHEELQSLLLVNAAQKDVAAAYQSGNPAKIQAATAKFQAVSGHVAALGKWEIKNDPGNRDDKGNPTPYRANATTGEYTTMDGKPYVPAGAANLGSGAGGKETMGAQESKAVDEMMANNSAMSRAEAIQKVKENPGKVTAQAAKDQAAVKKNAELSAEVGDLIKQIDENPDVVGTMGMIKHPLETIQGVMDPGTAMKTPNARFRSSLTELREKISANMTGSKFYSPRRQVDMTKIMPGLEGLTSPQQARDQLVRLKAQLDGAATENPGSLPDGVPEGSTKIGTKDGNDVYETPDKKRLMVTH